MRSKCKTLTLGVGHIGGKQTEGACCSQFHSFAYYDEKMELPFDSNETIQAAIFSELAGFYVSKRYVWCASLTQRTIYESKVDFQIHWRSFFSPMIFL